MLRSSVMSTGVETSLTITLDDNINPETVIACHSSEIERDFSTAVEMTRCPTWRAYRALKVVSTESLPLDLQKLALLRDR